MVALASGCGKAAESDDQPELVWGRVGIANGRFQKPRAIAIDADDQLYIVDMTARIQVFDRDGRFLRAWSTPVHENGRPTGLSMSRDGLLMVADTHYYRVLFYTPYGELREERTIGGTLGQGPGEFGFVTDAVQDSAGNYYVSEYGEFDRIQKFSPSREFVLLWGGHGEEPGQFARPQSMVLTPDDRLVVGPGIALRRYGDVGRRAVEETRGDASEQDTTNGPAVGRADDNGVESLLLGDFGEDLRRRRTAVCAGLHVQTWELFPCLFEE